MYNRSRRDEQESIPGKACLQENEGRIQISPAHPLFQRGVKPTLRGVYRRRDLVNCRTLPDFATASFSNKTTLSDFIEEFGLLTARRVRHIRSPSWRPETDNNRYGAKLPENPANIELSGQNSKLINGWVAAAQPCCLA